MSVERTITIPARANGHDGVVSETIGGARVFFCIEATAECQVKGNKGVGTHMVKTGISFGSERGREFTILTFYNSSANTITVTYYAGDELYAQQTTQVVEIAVTAVKDAPTYTKGANITQVNAGATLTYNGLDGTKQRKQIVICNNDPTDGSGHVLQVKDADGNLFDTVNPGQAKTYVSNGVFKVYNPGGAAVLANVGETFYS